MSTKIYEKKLQIVFFMNFCMKVVKQNKEVLPEQNLSFVLHVKVLEALACSRGLPEPSRAVQIISFCTAGILFLTAGQQGSEGGSCKLVLFLQLLTCDV